MNETIPRKYFSGGEGSYSEADKAMGHDVVHEIGELAPDNAQTIRVGLAQDDLAQVALQEYEAMTGGKAKPDGAMITVASERKVQRYLKKAQLVKGPKLNEIAVLIPIIPFDINVGMAIVNRLRFIGITTRINDGEVPYVLVKNQKSVEQIRRVLGLEHAQTVQNINAAMTGVEGEASTRDVAMLEQLKTAVRRGQIDQIYRLLSGLLTRDECWTVNGRERLSVAERSLGILLKRPIGSDLSILFSKLAGQTFTPKMLPRLFRMHRMVWEKKPFLGLRLLEDTADHLRGIKGQWGRRSYSDIIPEPDIQAYSHHLTDTIYLIGQLRQAEKALAKKGLTLQQWVERNINDQHQQATLLYVIYAVLVYAPSYGQRYFESPIIKKAMRQNKFKVLNHFSVGDIDSKWGDRFIDLWLDGPQANIEDLGREYPFLKRIRDFQSTPGFATLIDTLEQTSDAVSDYDDKFGKRLKKLDRSTDKERITEIDQLNIGDRVRIRLKDTQEWTTYAVVADRYNAQNKESSQLWLSCLNMAEEFTITYDADKLGSRFIEPKTKDVFEIDTIERLDAKKILQARGAVRKSAVPGVGGKALRSSVDGAMGARKGKKISNIEVSLPEDLREQGYEQVGNFGLTDLRNRLGPIVKEIIREETAIIIDFIRGKNRATFFGNNVEAIEGWINNRLQNTPTSVVYRVMQKWGTLRIERLDNAMTGPGRGVALPRVRADEGMRLEEKAKVPGVEGKADGAMIETEESLYVKARAANVILRYFSKQQGMYWVAQTEVKRLLTEYLLIPNKDDNAKDEMVVRINNAVKRQTKFSADLIKLLLNTIDIHFNLLTFFLNPDVRSMRGYNALSEVIAKLEKAGPWVAQPEIKEFISSYLLNSPKSIKYKSFFAEYIFYAMRGVKPSRDIPPLMLHAAEAMFQRLTVIDDAMTSRGGIDLKSANLAMTIKRDGNGIPIISQQDLAQISSNLEGLGPVILSIKPASQTTLFAELVTHP